MSVQNPTEAERLWLAVRDRFRLLVKQANLSKPVPGRSCPKALQDELDYLFGWLTPVPGTGRLPRVTVDSILEEADDTIRTHIKSRWQELTGEAV